MLSLIFRSIHRWPEHSALLALGLLAVTFGVVSVAAVSQTAVVQVNEDLSRSWRTTYDILVRPANVRSDIEEQYGLVEANHLSGLAGGITFAQYETIKAIPGVEVAAPIAMLGYFGQSIPAGEVGYIPDPGAYLLQESLTVSDGFQQYNSERQLFIYVGDDYGVTPRSGLNVPALRLPDSPAPVVSRFELPVLMAAIDPFQEAALVELDQTLSEGKYLTGDEPIVPDPNAPQTDPFGNPLPTYRVPVLIDTTPYVSLTLEADLFRLTLPSDTTQFRDIMAQGGIDFLASLPLAERLGSQEVDGAATYRSLIEQLLREEPASDEPRAGSNLAWSRPSQIEYREIEPLFSYDGLVLETVPVPQGVMRVGWVGEEWVAYRESQTSQLQASFTFDVRGLFDIEQLPRPDDVNRVPLETYFPPLVTLRYDESGQPVEPRTLRPTLNPTGYIQNPPLLLTTLDAAWTLAGESSISAIRVRVADVDQLTPAAQRKIETIASEIARRTGLTVDVMVGSSPRRVLVRVPGVGYVRKDGFKRV